MARRPYNGHAILWIEAYRRLTYAGWEVSATDDGMSFRNGRVRVDLASVDSIGSLMSADEVEEEIWHLRNVMNARKR